MLRDSASYHGLRVLLGVSSSISAYKALDLASMLRKAGAEVRAVLTEDACKIAGPAAFDAITHNRTITSLWDSPTAGEMDHLAATKWADLFVVAPATANTLATLAHGLAQDALGTLALAWNKGPLLIAPAMNPAMWANQAVQANVSLLQQRGHVIIGPAAGRMACDDVGTGRLASVEEIFAAIGVHSRRAQQPAGALAGKRILITSGPTREFADDVRCITNPSTGKQGLALGNRAKELGAQVTFITGPVSYQVPETFAKVVHVTTADEMLAAVLAELPSCDYAIFAAAVSDWKPVERHAGKEKKADVAEEMTLHLVRTPDIAATANKQRRPGQIFVGFAAESTNLEGYAGEKMQRKGFSLVFANPINVTGAGFGADTNRGLLLRADGTKREVATATKAQVAALLLDELAAIAGSHSPVTTP